MSTTLEAIAKASTTDKAHDIIGFWMGLRDRYAGQADHYATHALAALADAPLWSSPALRVSSANVAAALAHVADGYRMLAAAVFAHGRLIAKLQPEATADAVIK